MESSFKQGATGGKLQKSGQKVTDIQDECSTSFRIRGGVKPPTPSQNQARVPTIYGMPKMQAKALPKLDHQLGMMMSQDTQEEKSNIKLDASLKSILKKREKPSVSEKEAQQEQIVKKVQDEKDEEEKTPMESSKSRLSTAKSSVSNVSNQSSLAQTASQSSIIFDPNGIVDENTVLAEMVKTNVQLLQKCLGSTNKSIFFAAIESLKNASNNFGPALNKHLPIVLQLVKKKQDLANTERIHDLKQLLILNGGNEAEKIVNSIGLK